MTNAILKITVLFAVVFATNATTTKGSKFFQHLMTKRAAPPAGGAAAAGKGKQSYVFQTPNGFAHGHGHGYGYGNAFGGYGGFGLHGHGYGNLGHIHPVPVTGVKALSVAYDPVSGVPYVCDPNKKADAAAGAAGAKPAGAAAATGKRSEIKKDEIKVKIPDFPPCPDPKKSFPWSCLLGDKTSKREECARAKKAVQAASKRYWPAMAGFYPPMYGGYPFGYAGMRMPLVFGQPGPFGYNAPIFG